MVAPGFFGKSIQIGCDVLWCCLVTRRMVQEVAWGAKSVADGGQTMGDEWKGVVRARG